MRQFFKDIWDVLRGQGAEVEEPTGLSPCASYQRHLYLGGEFCRRGCGKTNPDYRPDAESAAVPSEGL